MTIDGLVLKPGFALGGYAVYKAEAQGTLVRRYVLLPSEVAAVQQSLESSGFAITALHNHLLNEVPVEAYAAGVRGWACAIPEGTVRVIGDSSGPNEQAMESLPALAVEHLSVKEAYRIGRAVHFIGFVLDQEQQRIKTGEPVHRLLLDKSLQRQVAAQPYIAEQLTKDFLDAFARRLSKDAAWLRDRILRYVDTEVAFRYPSEDLGELSEGDATSQRRAMAGYSHPKVEQLENDVLPFVPAFHVAGPLYDDLERSSWTTI